MSLWVGGFGGTVQDDRGYRFRVYLSLGDVVDPGPSRTWLFLDQREDSINWGNFGIPMQGNPSKGMEGLLAEAKEMMDEEGPDPVVDAGLIGAAQRVEHYEIAAYGSAIAFAELLGENEVAVLLRKSLEEEAAADRALTALAMKEVNETALAAGTRVSES